MKKKKALIFGVTGQDGSYLAELLLAKGYEVHGFARRTSTGNLKHIAHLLDDIELHAGDLADVNSCARAIRGARPDEIYNEADQDHAGWSYRAPDYSSDITGAAVGRLLEIVREVDPAIRFFQPLTSNMFGQLERDAPANEETLLNPQSPYACAKAYAWMLARYYRRVHRLHVCCAIFFNHESPRRSEEYVTHKITRAAVRISKGLQKELLLGDLSLKVDFGFAKEYMEAAWNIMQLPEPDDFVIGTGKAHAIQEFLEEAFRAVGLDARRHVRFDERFLRPGKTSALVADAAKARRAFGFTPRVGFPELVRMLIDCDAAEADKELAARAPSGCP
ncbi:MAG: GDP-mannose 4,6-dehydratase [Elusimicrobia bacterium]|nr:GDP-mannose 4,6-dehydratase [Elusimicrobiota bacterium]MDE2425052.1 GDP-mannose 4,6-dehydratase [Elusimicrobiota bacterium]